MIIHDGGLRLEPLQQSQSSAIKDLVAVSLSETGFAKAQAAIKVNKLLGKLCNCSSILNEHSYM